MFADQDNLKEAFDSVHQRTLLRSYESLWDSYKDIGLLTGLYSPTMSAVKYGWACPAFFPVSKGTRQGCALAPSLFNIHIY